MYVMEETLFIKIVKKTKTKGEPQTLTKTAHGTTRSLECDTDS